MIQREAIRKFKEMGSKFPILVLTGPRQSGKTTLGKMAFPGYRYVSLENPDNLSFALNDPRGFLDHYDKHVFFDEIQNAPILFSYLQQIVDDSDLNGQFILSGSQNFSMLEKITQSLAGRVYIMTLLPLSSNEIQSFSQPKIGELIYKGGYPRIFSQNIHPNDFFPSYIETYIERDVRSIINVQNLSLFKRFVELCAGYAGQLWNANKVSKILQINQNTVQSWFSVLETSYIVFSLRPWHHNFSKRIYKTPKLYFYDTGLLAHLLGLEREEDWVLSMHKGALFENFGMLEILKNYYNNGVKPNLYFWRDSNQNEIDLIIEQGNKIKCVEMKASETIKPEFIKSLHYLDDFGKGFEFQHYLLNSGETTQKRTNETILGWKDISKIIH